MIVVRRYVLDYFLFKFSWRFFPVFVVNLFVRVMLDDLPDVFVRVVRDVIYVDVLFFKVDCVLVFPKVTISDGYVLNHYFLLNVRLLLGTDAVVKVRPEEYLLVDTA